MNVNSQFFLDFMNPFFNGLISIFKQLLQGLLEMFNVVEYASIIKEYSAKMGSGGIFIIILTVLCLLGIIGLIVFLLIKFIRRKMKYRRNVVKQESMVEEIDNLNMEIIKLKQENQKYIEMADPDKGGVEYDEDGNIINKITEGESRFFKLSKVDEVMKNYTPPAFDNNISLNELCTRFKNFSASKLRLYYTDDIIRLFIAAFASNRLIILQGISGTGKTSLAYAFGKLLKNETTVASVQPSWRDSTELFGYFNEFTKRFNETEVLSKMYEALYTDRIYLTLLDEMNISRVEYYFAEMLSILELPSKSEWIIELVTNVWDNDPIKLSDGKIKIPDNMWYIGTINNDDSTFMITDKVYDRAMPIDINDKCEPFEVPATEALDLSYKHLDELFLKAQKEHAVSNEIMTKINQMDKYVIEHFRLAFGNRIVKQLREFVPVYVACGGTELRGIDYLICHKILRKFEQLNLAYIRDQIDGYIAYMNELFGDGSMPECVDYLTRLKKTI